jgi:hypothetical protein
VQEISAQMAASLWSPPAQVTARVPDEIKWLGRAHDGN